MLKIQSLASGSKGNCTLVASENTRILIDVGLGLPELARRLADANTDPTSVKAVLVTHEHTDHIKGIAPFIKKYKCTLYVHENAAETLPQFIGYLPHGLVKTFSTSFQIDDMTVDFFPVSHDSLFCFGFTFQKGDCKVSMATDLGRVSREMYLKMANSQVVLLECNHDLEKLHNNVKYPTWLKRRIAGSMGHLSNAACSLAVYELAKQNVQQIILAHLSEENNTPTLAYTFVRDFLAGKGIQEGVDISIDIAHQDKVGTVFQID